MSKTTTTTVTKEYDEKGRLVKETTVTTVADSWSYVQPQPYPYQYPITWGQAQSVQTTTPNTWYTINGGLSTGGNDGPEAVSA